MRRLLLLIALLALLGTAGTWAIGNFGLGIIMGQPTGLAAKQWMGVNTSLDAAVAWSFLHQGALYFHTDLQFHTFGSQPLGGGRLGVYVGVGGRVLVSDTVNLGFRVPLGVLYLFAGVPLDLFVELSPTLELFPATAMSGGAAMGLRYYF
jgi:hypothetical protein